MSSSTPRVAACVPRYLPALLVIALGACAQQGAGPSASSHAAAPSTDSGSDSGADSGAEIGRTGSSVTGTQGHAGRPPARHVRGEGRPAPSSAATDNEATGEGAAWVAAHNLHRARVSPAASPALPSVRWSPELAATAQRWAERCDFNHSSSEYGENLSARTYMVAPEDVVAGWAAEGEHFDYRNNRCAKGEVCGHYTQVVWRDSTEIGCAAAQCGGGGPFGGGPWVLWVCNYSPAGNWSGVRPY